MIKSIAILDIIAAVTIVSATLVAPSFACSGNTFIYFSNSGKARASGFGTLQPTSNQTLSIFGGTDGCGNTCGG